MLNKAWKPTPEILFSHGEKAVAPDEQHVSVIVTNYNYADYVIECLDSIAAQTHATLLSLIHI